MRIKPSPRDFPPTLRKVLGVLEGGGASYEDIVSVFDYSGRSAGGKAPVRRTLLPLSIYKHITGLTFSITQLLHSHSGTVSLVVVVVGLTR